MTKNDAMMFPLIASGALLGLYIVFKIFSVAHINLLLTGYFFFLGVLALSHRIPALADIPEIAGYAIVAVGLADFFVIPLLLARRWKSPRP